MRKRWCISHIKIKRNIFSHWWRIIVRNVEFSLLMTYKLNLLFFIYICLCTVKTYDQVLAPQLWQRDRLYTCKFLPEWCFVFFSKALHPTLLCERSDAWCILLCAPVQATVFWRWELPKVQYTCEQYKQITYEARSAKGKLPYVVSTEKSIISMHVNKL